MKKAKLLASAAVAAPPHAAPARGKKPIPMIGTMQKNTTAEQRKAFAKMKHQLKKAARAARYHQHLQETAAGDKP